MDSAVTPQVQTDVRTSDIELPCDQSNLAIDGTPPEVGDIVDVQLGGKITRVVNGTAWIQPTEINHQPIPDTPMERNNDMDELDRVYNMSQQSGKSSDGY